MTVRHRFIFAVAVGSAGIVGLAGLATAADSPWKDLRILRKDIPKNELKAVMKAQVKALGVDGCEHCHEMPDTDKDTEKKTIARQMMRITDDINERLRNDKLESQIGCITCHVGHQKPEIDASMTDVSKKSKKKEIVKEMQTLTDEINAKYYKDAKKPEDKIRCDTCHYGKEKPEHLLKK